MKLVLALLAVAACKRDNASPPPEEPAVASGAPTVAPVTRAGALERLRAAKRDMCGCKDRACVERVRNELTTWVDQQVEAAGSSTTAFAASDQRESEDLMRDTFACEDALLDKLPPEKPIEPAVVKATAAIEMAREKARTRKARLAAVSIEARYAKSDGSLDPTYGELRVEFRAPPPGSDDPSRPLGAPVREHAPESADSDCPTWTLAAKSGEWAAESGPCMPTVALAPRCSVEQIWARAIADGAPREALATVSLGGREKQAPAWRFRIEDRPRKLDIDKTYADDCAPTSP